MQSLGGYTFYWNPDEMTIPEKMRDVSVTKTYGGSAIFEWAAVLQGKKVELKWRFMPKGMYKKLRELYVPIGQVYEWDPETGGNTYNVKITNLEGGYHEVVLHDGKYRPEATLTLDIRSLNQILQSSTTPTTPTV